MAPPRPNSSPRRCPAHAAAERERCRRWRQRSFSLPLSSPLGTATGEITSREGVLVGIVVDGARR
ncbi:MAG: hypothetical protein ABEH80_04555, partial [Halobaculum sp.]